VSLPAFAESADLPPGVHRATLREAMERLATGSMRRRVIALRLERIYHLARSTGHLGRFVVFGSFVTAKPDPNDVDIFLVMADSFDVGQVTGEARLLFDHAIAQAHFGASVFWLRRLACLEGEEEAIRHWQTKRDGGQRGIVEIIQESP
jgi:hypothetical protein